MSAHAIYAPSSAHRWSVCTASARAISVLPPQEEGEEAAEGTEAHTEIERCYKKAEEAGCGPIMLLDFEHPAAYGIALVFDYVRKLPPGRLYVEQRVTLTDDIWGRCDVAHFDEPASVLTIVDYKNGFVDVQAEKNEQLRIYAGGVIRTFDIKPKWIRYVVVQPNSIMPVPRVKQWVESVEDLQAFVAFIEKIPEARDEFVAGEQCKYCPLFGRCPASQDILVRLGTALASPPDALHPGQVAYFKAMQKPIEDWFESFGKVWTKRALAPGGEVPPGMKIVTGTTRRTWRDEAAARALIVDKLGVAALDPPTPAQAEKMGLAPDVVETLSMKPEGGPVLAMESDRRPEFKRKSAAEMFAGVTGK